MFGFKSVATCAFRPFQGPVAQWPVVRNKGGVGGLFLQDAGGQAGHTVC